MSTIIVAIDWASKGLTLLVLLLAALWVAWQLFEGLAKVTSIGAEFRHFICNRRAFERWNREIDEEQNANQPSKGSP